MKRQRRLPGFETWNDDDQFLTDSIVMRESDVNSMLGNEVPNSRNASGVMLSGLVLSKREERLFWVLIFLALVVP
jgi:hypothetical protein